MILPDVNLLVIAHREDQDDHAVAREWLENVVNSERPFALADIAASGFLRIVTNPRIYVRPSALETAVAFIDGLAERQTCVPVAAGPRHWQILSALLRSSDARGNLVPDAHLAAIAIEHGATIATRDRGFSRFPDLPWLDPLAG